MSKIQYLIHFAIFFLGACLLGFGVALYCIANLGADPLSTFALGIKGIWSLLVEDGIICISYGMIVITFLLKRSNLGLGSFLYPFISGVATKFGFLIIPVFDDVWIRYVLLCSGIICMSISIAITSKTRVGYSPYDALAFALMEKWNCSYSKVRWFMDGSFLCLGLLLGAIFDTGTIIVLVIMGPCASCCMKLLEKLLNKFKTEGGNT